MNLFKDKNFTPMLLGEIFKPFDSQDYFFELKFDGNRALIFANKKKVEIYNRHKQNITYLYPELQKIKDIVNENCIFDGEIISVVDGKPSFSKLQERAHLKKESRINKEAISNPVIFIAFDCLYKKKDITNETLEERKKVLNTFKDTEYFIKSKYISTKGKALFKFVQKENMEGIVAKKKNSKYEIDTRSNAWLKIKNWQKENYYVISYVDKENHLQVHLASLVKQKFKYVGKVLVYKTNKAYEIIKNTSFKNYKVEGFDLNLKTIKPVNMVQVAFIEKTKKGNLRQPLFIAILNK